MITNYKKKNLKLFAVFILTVSLSLIFIEQIIAIFLKLGRAVNYNSLSFKIGYWGVVAFILSYYIFKISKRYLFSKTTTFFVFYFTAIYVIFRIIFIEHIAFIKLYKAFAYADVIFVILFFHILGLLRVSSKQISSFIDFFKKSIKSFIVKLKSIINYVKSHFGKKKKEKNEKENDAKKNKNAFFLEDTRVVEETIDNELILQKLISIVRNFKPDEAFSIGLNASWGHGKSAFFKRFEHTYIEKPSKEIVFWYRIWKNKGANAIIENFFAELKKELAPFSGEISGTIDKYVSAILSLSNSDLKKVIEVGKSLLQENETLEGYHNGINKTIKKIDKQIIITNLCSCS